MFSKKIISTIALSLILLTSGCLKKKVLKIASDGIAYGDGSLFSGDEDIKFIGVAMPFALKMQEGIAQASPNHSGIQVAVSKGFTSYAFIYLAFPSDTLSDDFYDEKEDLRKRAKMMYLRARDYGIKGLEVNNPNFMASLKSNSDSLISTLSIKESDAIYWTALAWMGAFTMDNFDLDLSVSKNYALEMIAYLYTINPYYGNGAIDEFYISYYGALPNSMGGSEEKARGHFKMACAYNSKIESAGPYIALATSVAINKSQDYKEFESLLEKAISIDPKADKANLLLRNVQNIKARWLLAHIDDYFLID